MEFLDLTQTQVLNNGNQQPPINITASQLSGTDMYATVWAQLRLLTLKHGINLLLLP